MHDWNTDQTVTVVTGVVKVQELGSLELKLCLQGN